MAGSLLKGITFEEALDIALTQRQLTLAAGKKPTKMERREVETAFLETFELIGGIPRLAIWANDAKNYGEFLKLYSRLLPKEVDEKVKETFVYVSNVPQSPLNRPAQITRIDEPEVGDGS